MIIQVKTAFPALAYRNFRLFWFGQCISLIGTWMQTTAQQWLVYTLTKSAFLLGLLGVAQFGPMLCLSLVAGVFIDRYPKKNMILFTQTFLMIQAFALGVLICSGHIVYWEVLVLAALQGLINTLDIPTRQSLISYLVDRKDLSSALGLNSAVFNIARMIAPALSAVLIAQFGTGLLFLFNGITFIPVIIGLYLIKVESSGIKQVRRKVFSEMLEGLNYIRHSIVLSSTVLSLLAVGTFVMNFNLLLPVYATETLGQGVYGFSFISSAVGAGSLIGALLVAVRAKGNPSLRFLFGSALLVSLLLVILNFIHALPLAVVMFVIIGFVNIFFAISANTTIQLNSSEQFKGRVMSVYSFAFVGTTPIGNLFAGSIAEKLGPGMGFFMNGAVSGILIIFTIINFLLKKHTLQTTVKSV